VQVRGSAIDPGGVVSLKADNGRVLLEASQNKVQEHSESSSSPASVELTAGLQGGKSRDQSHVVQLFFERVEQTLDASIHPWTPRRRALVPDTCRLLSL
jgi:Hemagglutinin repeat